MDRISILLANRNTLSCLKLCLKSLRENLARKDHHILIMDDASTDGSVEWLQENQAKFGYELELHEGPKRKGIVDAYNLLVTAAQTPIVWMVHTDMYFARNSDAETAKYLAPATVATCTRIEPPLYPEAPYRLQADLGVEPEEFREKEFLELADAKNDPERFTEGAFAPVMCYKEDYLGVGGLDPAFAPQSREDSDLFNRMAVAGYRFRQSWSAFCYHFSGRGSRKKDGIASDSEEWKRSNSKNERNFIRRWGQSVKHDEYLKPIVVPKEPISLVALLGNEPDNVVPFLENLEPFFDEVVFVADGHQSDSAAMIEEYVKYEEAKGPTLLRREKIRVCERALAGDFSAQRNFGQEQCSSEWVLHADLDERFDRGLLENLQGIVRTMRRGGKTVCGFARLNYLDGVLVNDLPREEWTPDGLERAGRRERKAVRNPDPQFRLLRRGVSWHRKVHETPEPLGRDRRVVMYWPHAVIHHPKTLDRQRGQDARYEGITPGASLSPAAGREGEADRLRVLMLATEYPPARGYGLGRYCCELSEALARLGVEVHVVNQNYDGGKPSFTHAGVTVHIATERDNPAHYSWVSESVAGNLWLMERAGQVIREQGPFDLVMAHDWLGSLAAKGLKAIHGLPLVLFMHDTEPGKRGNKLVAEQLYIAEVETWACKHADALVANSSFIARELGRFHKVPAEKMTVVSPGVNPARFKTDCHLPDFRALLADPDEKLVLYVGRLSPMKGVDLLMEAAPAILARHPKCRFVIAGEGVLRRPLEEQTAGQGLAGRLRFVGHLAGTVLGAAYRAADLVVIPSRYEPFGMVALESMSCGTPVVASDVGGLKEIVPSDGLNRRFGADSVEALTSSVTAALSRRVSADDRERLRSLAGGHTWDMTAEGVLEVCRRALGSPQEVHA